MKIPTAFLFVAIPLGVWASDLGNILTPVVSAPSGSAASQFGSSQSNDIAPEVVTSTGQNLITSTDVIDALQRELTARLSLEGELKLSFIQPWNSISVKGAKNWKLVIDQLPIGGLTSTSQIRFRIESGGQNLGEWQQSVRAQILRPVWFTSRRLDRGEIPDSSVCSPKTYDILSEKLSLVPADTDLSVYEMAQTVTQERPLAWRDISLRPLVKKGQLVDVVIAEGAMNISMKGIALGSGGAGEKVSIRNIDSRKEFSAMVVRPNTVQVKF